MYRTQKICAEILISAVQSRIVLWDGTHRDYKNKNVTNKEWHEVGIACNCTGAAAKAKWKNLKDTYRRILQKIPRLTSGHAAKTHIKWPYFELMSYIKHTISTDPTVGYVTEDDDSITDTTYELFSESNSTPSTSKSNTSTNSRKRKSSVDREFLEIDNEDLESYIYPNNIEPFECEERKKESEDEDLLFFKSLLPFFQKFNHIEKLEIRNEIQNIIIAKLKNKQ